MGSQTQSITLHERPLLLRFNLQRLELFAQHGRRVMEHARHRVSGALRLLQSFPGHLDNERVTACSPLDSRDASDVVLALVLQLFENLAELALDLELVMGINRILATWTSRSSAVTKCCSAYPCSLSSLATRNGPVQVLSLIHI